MSRRFTKAADFEVARFAPHLFSSTYGTGCGATALATLSGQHPLNVVEQCFGTKKAKYWPDYVMLRFLKREGFEVCKLSPSVVLYNMEDLVCNQPTEYPISYRHVILISQRLTQEESSWAVWYNNYVFHNFTVTSLGNLELVNHPMISAYLVKHYLWKVDYNWLQQNTKLL